MHLQEIILVFLFALFVLLCAAQLRDAEEKKIAYTHANVPQFAIQQDETGGK